MITVYGNSCFIAQEFFLFIWGWPFIDIVVLTFVLISINDIENYPRHTEKNREHTEAVKTRNRQYLYLLHAKSNLFSHMAKQQYTNITENTINIRWDGIAQWQDVGFLSKGLCFNAKRRSMISFGTIGNWKVLKLVKIHHHLEKSQIVSLKTTIVIRQIHNRSLCMRFCYRIFLLSYPLNM